MNSLIHQFLSLYKSWLLVIFEIVNSNVMSSNDLFRYEVSIKIVFLYNVWFKLEKYLTLVMNCLHYRLDR